MKRFKSKFGILLALAYFAFLLFCVLDVIASPPDAMSGIALAMVTAPWSFLFLVIVGGLVDAVVGDAGRIAGPVIFVLIFIVSAAMNGVILYLIGWLLTLVGNWLNKVSERE